MNTLPSASGDFHDKTPAETASTVSVQHWVLNITTDGAVRGARIQSYLCLSIHIIHERLATPNGQTYFATHGGGVQLYVALPQAAT